MVVYHGARGHSTSKGTRPLRHIKNSQSLQTSSSSQAKHPHDEDRTNLRPHMAPINRDCLCKHENDHSAAQVLVETSRPTYVKASPLRKLPAELALYIMEAVDSSSDMKNLILTAPIFNHLWKLHTFSISSAVLSRSIECFDEAEKLEEALHPRISFPVSFEAAVARHARMACAASLVSDIYDLFVIHYPFDLLHENVLCPNDRDITFPNNEDSMWFRRSFYCLWLLVITAEHKRPKPRTPPLQREFEFKTTLNSSSLPNVDPLSFCELIFWVMTMKRHSSGTGKSVGEATGSAKTRHGDCGLGKSGRPTLHHRPTAKSPNDVSLYLRCNYNGDSTDILPVLEDAPHVSLYL